MVVEWGPPSTPHTPLGGPPPPCRPLGLGAGAPLGSQGRLFFVADSEGMWCGLGGGGGRFPTQSGGRGFPLLLLHLSPSLCLRWCQACPGMGLGVRTPKSRPQSPGSPITFLPLIKAPFSALHPLFFQGPQPTRPQGGELRRRGSLLDSCCLPFSLPGSSDPISPDTPR